MNLFDKLNLRPQERRLVVIVGIVVFVVLNFWLVIPMFGEYGRTEQRIRDTSKKLNEYKQEIQKRSGYSNELSVLERQGGYVPTEEAGLRLSQEVSSQAALSGVYTTGVTPVQRQGTGGKTNAFFDEAAVSVNFSATGEKELIDFLYRLADKELLIRAKSMQIGSDPSQMRLQGNMTLVKSYQRRPPPKAPATRLAGASAAASTSSPAPKVQPSPKPAATAPPTVAPATPAPIPAPTLPPSGASTNRSRRALPAPVKP
jgi:hypothetical protein